MLRAAPIMKYNNICKITNQSTLEGVSFLSLLLLDENKKPRPAIIPSTDSIGWVVSGRKNPAKSPTTKAKNHKPYFFHLFFMIKFLSNESSFIHIYAIIIEKEEQNY